MSRLLLFKEYVRLDLAGNELRSELLDVYSKLGWTCAHNDFRRILIIAPDSDSVDVRFRFAHAAKAIADAALLPDLRLAVVARQPKIHEAYKADETKARALGMAARIFAEEDEALAWLLAD